jgi:hypothetical protein
MFTGGDAPPDMEAANVDGFNGIDIADLVYLVDYMFTGGPAPLDYP